MSTRSICQRCHRLRPTGSGRYCATCQAYLDADKRPRRVVAIPPEQAAAIIAAAAANKAAAAAVSTPPPPAAEPSKPHLRAVPDPLAAPPPAPSAPLVGLPAFVLPTMEDEAG